MEENIQTRVKSNPNAMTTDANTGETLITKAKYDGKGQGYGGQQKKVRNINNNNTARTI
jgi:hypothetical protein